MKAKTKTTATKEEAIPALVPLLRRCPKLVWIRAVGPVFSPNGAAAYQPRATPWVNGPTSPSPEGATHLRTQRV